MKIALAAAFVVGAASAALANDIDESASAPPAQRDWREWQQGLFQKNHMGNGAGAYGYVQSPRHDRTKPGKNSYSR